MALENGDCTAGAPWAETKGSAGCLHVMAAPVLPGGCSPDAIYTCAGLIVLVEHHSGMQKGAGKALGPTASGCWTLEAKCSGQGHPCFVTLVCFARSEPSKSKPLS